MVQSQNHTSFHIEGPKTFPESLEDRDITPDFGSLERSVVRKDDHF